MLTVAETLTITVMTTAGVTATFCVSEAETIENFKFTAQQIFGSDWEILTYDNQVLADERHLYSYDIGDRSLLSISGKEKLFVIAAN